MVELIRTPGLCPLSLRWRVGPPEITLLLFLLPVSKFGMVLAILLHLKGTSRKKW
jgi:hypothetical protein